MASLRIRGAFRAYDMRWKLAALVILLLAPAGAGQNDRLDRRIQDNEDIVRTLQQIATKLYQSRSDIIGNCSCTVHACANKFPPGRECSNKLGHSEEICGHCETQGKLLDFLRSMVRTPPGEDPEVLSIEVIESVCTFQPLDEAFVKNGLAGDNVWTYIATTTGVD
ncbi:unnamed protein product, partial [Ostreobium quekettii]